MNSSDIDIIDINTANVFLVGDLHGYAGCLPYYFSGADTTPGALIILGDIGLGFVGGNDNEIFSDFIKLIKKGWSVYLLRGNHDNPAVWKIYSKDTLIKSCIDKEDIPYIDHLYFLKDNTILNINGYLYYTVSGGVSIDSMARIKNISFWEDEGIYVPDDIDEIIKSKTGKEIYGILSHTGPTPPELKDNNVLNYWLDMDKTLNKRLNKERESLNNCKKLFPKKWFYGHFHINSEFTTEEGIFCRTIAPRHYISLTK